MIVIRSNQILKFHFHASFHHIFILINIQSLKTFIKIKKILSVQVEVTQAQVRSFLAQPTGNMTHYCSHRFNPVDWLARPKHAKRF